MNEQNIIERFLSKVKLPGKIPIDKKNELKNELLNSRHFKRRKGKLYIYRREIGFSFAVFVTAVIILFAMKYKSENKTIQDILSKLDNQYAAFLSPDKLGFFESYLNIFGENNDTLKLKVNNIFNPSDSSYNITIRDVEYDVMLDNKIFKGDEVFGIPEPKLTMLNTKTSANPMIFDFELSKISEIPNLDSIEFTIQNKIKNRLPFLPDKGMIVINTDYYDNSEVKQKQDQRNILYVNKEINVDEMIRSNPIDLINDLRKDTTAVFIGTKFDEKLGDEFDILETRTKVTYSEAKQILVKVFKTQVDSVDPGKLNIKSNSKRSVVVHTNSPNENSVFIEDNPAEDIFWIRTDSNENSFSYQFEKKDFDKLNIIKINSESGIIQNVIIALEQEKKRINLGELVFVSQRTGMKDLSLFDPVKNNMISLTGKKIIHSFNK